MGIPIPTQYKQSSGLGSSIVPFVPPLCCNQWWIQTQHKQEAILETKMPPIGPVEPKLGSSKDCQWESQFQHNTIQTELWFGFVHSALCTACSFQPMVDSNTAQTGANFGNRAAINPSSRTKVRKLQRLPMGIQIPTQCKQSFGLHSSIVPSVPPNRCNQ